MRRGRRRRPATPIEEECPEDLPEKFDGLADMLVPFMSQCQLFMEKSTRDFSVVSVRVCFVTSMMTDAPPLGLGQTGAFSLPDAQLPSLHDRNEARLRGAQRREAANARSDVCAREWGGGVHSNAFQMIAQDLDWNRPA